MIDINIGDKINMLTIINGPIRKKISKRVVLYYICQCVCGTIKEITKRNLSTTKSCGCYKKLWNKLSKPYFQKDRIGEVYGKLTILNNSFKKSNRYFYSCLCSCGAIKDINQSGLLSGKIVSCGCQNQKSRLNKRKTRYEGLRFGKLLILKWAGQTSLGGAYECLCDCGKSCLKDPRTLNSTSRCNDCNNKVNGQKISNPQRQVHQILNQGILNYKVDKFCIDIATVINGKKIAIEYDGWYWHKNKLDKDSQRESILLNKGWYIFRIQSDELIPTKEQIDKKLQELNPSNRIVKLVLSDWGETNRR